jgi:hypothetical protein
VFESVVKRLEKRVNVIFLPNHVKSLTLDGAAYYRPKHLTLRFTVHGDNTNI